MSLWTSKRIKALRARYGESQPRFAQRLRVSAETIRFWEQDRGVPSGPAELLLDRLEEDIDTDSIRSVDGVGGAAMPAGS